MENIGIESSDHRRTLCHPRRAERSTVVRVFAGALLHLGDTEVGQLGLQLIQLLSEFRLGLGLLPQLVALNFGLEKKASR